LNKARDTLLDADLRAELNLARRARVRDSARNAGGSADRGQEQAAAQNVTVTGPGSRQRPAHSQAPYAKQPDGQALLGGIAHSRIGQWIAVVMAVALMVPLMTLAGWSPVLAPVAAALLAAAMISTYNQQVRGSPLGDMLAAAKLTYSFVMSLIRRSGGAKS
jgi:hypothetical protein